MPWLTFEPAGVRVEAAPGESVFAAARRSGVAVSTACVGKATCGLCRVKVESGEQHLSPFGGDERKHLGNVYFITKERLSCQARLLDHEGAEVTVRVPPVRSGGSPR